MATSAPAAGVLPPGGSPPGVVGAPPPVTAGGGALDPGADPALLEGAGDGGGDIVPPLPGGGGLLAQQDSEDIPQKRKATSFKITNVFLSRPPSNDGEDSCEDGEDLEDSHTEDLSDITDLNSLNNLSSQLEFVVGLTGTVNGGLGVAPAEGLQTLGAGQGKPPAAPGKQPAASQPPKEAGGGQVVTRKPSNGAGDRRPSADKQVWEAFSHPGFGFVTYQQAGGATFPVSYVDNTTGYLPVAGTMAVINNVEKGGVSEVPVSSQTQHGPQDFRNRFKIVKVETTEPLKRGRWTCFDFVDKPAAKEKEALPAGPSTAGPSKPVAAPTTAQGPKNPTVSRPASEVIKDGLASSRRVSDLVTGGLMNAATVGQGMTMSVQGGTLGATVPPQGATIRSEAGATQRPPDTQQRLPGVPSDSTEPRRIPGQTETSPAPVSSLSSGSVSEDRELEGAGKSQNNGRVTGSVPPDGLRGPHVSFPSQSNYPPTSSAPPPHSISLSGPSASLTGAQPAVQSPHTVGRPEFPQATLGQIVRMHDGQLAQVALAPFPGGTQQQAGGQQQPAVMLKPLPASTSHSLSPGQQQVVVQNKQGQQFLVQQPPSINTVPPANRPPASQPGAQPAAAAVQPVKKVSQQQQPTLSQQQQPPASQQQQPVTQPTVTQSQQKPFSPGSQTTPVAGTAMQPTPQQAPVAPTSQPSTPLPAQPTASSQQPPAVGQQQGDRGAGGVVSQPSGGQSSQTQQNQNTSQATTPASLSTAVSTIQWTAGQQPVISRTNTNTQPHIVTVASQGQCGTVVSSVGVSSVAQSPVSVAGHQVSSGSVVLGVTQAPVMATGLALPPQTSVPPVCLPSSTATAPLPYYTVGYVAGGLVTPGGGQDLAGLDGDGLVERLEDLVSTQHEEGQGGELEHESASGAGQGSIDNRIEQAMDLVKSHLMSAVRSEVEELRDKISKLEDTVTILSRENEVLRSNVAPEVLASLTGGNRSLGLSCPPPDSSSSHPALQQSSNH